MMKFTAGSLVLAVTVHLLCAVTPCVSIATEDLHPYGETEGDTILMQQNDTIELETSFVLFGQRLSSVFVSI